VRLCGLSALLLVVVLGFAPSALADTVIDTGPAIFHQSMLSTENNWGQVLTVPAGTTTLWTMSVSVFAADIAYTAEIYPFDRGLEQTTGPVIWTSAPTAATGIVTFAPHVKLTAGAEYVFDLHMVSGGGAKNLKVEFNNFAYAGGEIFGKAGGPPTSGSWFDDAPNQMVMVADFKKAGGSTDEPIPLPPPPPVTKPATDVTGTSATLHGTVGRYGDNYHFEWGTTTAYGNSTPSTFGTSGDLPAAIAGLSPGTTYHFRIVADTQAAGADLEFTTPVAGSGGADLSIVIASGPTNARAKTHLTYTFTIANTGTTAVRGAGARMKWTGAYFPLVSAPGCRDTGWLVCVLPDLAPGESVTITAVVTCSKAGHFNLAAETVPHFTDPTPADDADHLSLTLS
jgi:hypothetical protein